MPGRHVIFEGGLVFFESYNLIFEKKIAENIRFDLFFKKVSENNSVFEFQCLIFESGLAESHNI